LMAGWRALGRKGRSARERRLEAGDFVRFFVRVDDSWRVLKMDGGRRYRLREEEGL